MPSNCAGISRPIVATVLTDKTSKSTIACCEFTSLSVAQPGGIADPTSCACAHDRKLKCRNVLLLSNEHWSPVCLYGDRTKWYRTKWHGQNGTDKMVYGQNGMGQNGSYGQNGMDKMVRTKW